MWETITTGPVVAALITFVAIAALLWWDITRMEKRAKAEYNPESLEPHIEENAEPGILFYAGTKYAKLLTLSQIAEKNHYSQTYYDQITERNTVLDTPLDREIWTAAYNSHMNRMLRERQYPLVLFNENGTTTQLADRDQVLFYRAARAADFDLKIIKQRMPATGEKQGSNDSE
jgi:hypothetical protein